MKGVFEWGKWRETQDMFEVLGFALQVVWSLELVVYQLWRDGKCVKTVAAKSQNLAYARALLMEYALRGGE